MKRRHYVYLLTRALPEGGCRYYVGIRTAPKNRTPETDTSYMGSGRRIKLAVKAHRAEFTKTIVEVFETRDEAKAMERALVGLPTANSPYSYNLRQGGEDGGLHSEETKAKIGTSNRRRLEDPAELEAQRERNRRPDWREKNRVGQRRRYEDPAEREKTGAANRKRYEDPAEVEAHAERMREVARRPEVKAKHAAASTSSWVNATEEQRAARIAAAREARRAPEVVERHRAANRALWASMTPEERCTEGKRRWLVAQETRRTKREVQWILAALIVNKYGGAEAA